MKPSTYKERSALVAASRAVVDVSQRAVKFSTVAGLWLAAMLVAGGSVAQTTGTSATSCTQSGTTLTCTSTTQYSLPAGVNLQAGTGQSVFTLTGAASNTPQCSGGLVASPSSVAAGTATTVSLALQNCPASGVTYSWAAPAVPTANPASTNAAHQLTLQAANATQTYSVAVCSISDPNSCTTYTTSVTATGTTATPLAGCSVTGAPASTVAIGSSYTLTAQCNQGTISARQWRLNGVAISGATGATYVIPTSATTAGAALTYSVTLTGSDASTATPSTTVTVAAASSGSCTTTGSPGTTISYSTPYLGLNGLTIGGNRAVYIIAYNVAAGDSSAGKIYLPSYGATNSPVTGFSYRTVTVSTCPNDFSSSEAQVLATDNYDFNISFTTEAARAGNGTALVQPGRTYYINIRNDSCPAGQVCSLDGQYRNWNQ